MENYEQIIMSLLNLTTNDIESIAVSEKKIKVSLVCNDTKCQYCGSHKIVSKGYYQRKCFVPVGALDGYEVLLKTKRYQCKECMHSFANSRSMVPPKSNLSYKSILLVMDLLKNPSMTFKQAAQLSGVSETSVIRLFDKHVHISRNILPEVICVDEVYTKNTDYENGKFSFIIYDFINRSIVDFVPTRRKFSLYTYFENIPENERNNVKFICMDMYFTYKMVAQKYFKKAIICVDNFHVLKHLNEDLSKVRVRIMNRYNTKSQEYYLLKNFNFLLFNETIELDNTAKFNKRFNRYLNFRDILNMMLSIDSDLYNGYKLKRWYYSFSRNMEEENKREMLNKIIDSFNASSIPEFDEFITLLVNWKEEIINSFSTYKGKRINNSIAESVNSSIKTLLFNTKGIRNHKRRRIRIMYAINKNGFSLK